MEYSTGCFPLPLAVISCGENFHPIGYWTIVSKEPFRFLISIGNGNHTLGLIRKIGEVGVHFFGWEHREWIVRAGYISGRDVKKAERLNIQLLPAEKMETTRLLSGYENAYECKVLTEIKNISVDHTQFVLDVIAAHETTLAEKRNPILFFSQKNFTTVGKEQWLFRK